MSHKRIYKTYLSWMSKLGGYRPKSHPSDHPDPQREMDKDFQSIDGIASKYGDQYRGVGVLVGLLGIAVVFVAVTPAGLDISSPHLLLAISGLKICLMLWILWLVKQFGQSSQLSKSWIHSRRKAEEMRYAELKKIKEELAKSMHAPMEHVKNLRDELSYILNGQEGQIAYNLAKGEQYEAIERLGEKLSWWGFGAALFCAVLLFLSEIHLIDHMPWMIFGTAALPALVGGIHGINGFLKIGSLAEEHMEMAKLLKGFSIELENAGTDDAETVLSIAERTYSQLVSRDVLWGESTQKSAKIKPA